MIWQRSGPCAGFLFHCYSRAVLVPLGLADRDSHGQVEATEELFKVGGILAGGIDADVEVRLGMSLL
jgi:hypothetical protein